MNYVRFALFVIWTIVAIAYIWQCTENGTIILEPIENKFGGDSFLAKLISITITAVVVGGALVLFFVWLDGLIDSIPDPSTVVNMNELKGVNK